MVAGVAAHVDDTVLGLCISKFRWMRHIRAGVLVLLAEVTSKSFGFGLKVGFYIPGLYYTVTLNYFRSALVPNRYNSDVCRESDG